MTSLDGQLPWQATQPVRPTGRALGHSVRGPILARAQAALVLALLVYAIYAGASAMPYEWQWSRVPQFLFFSDADGFHWGTLSIGFAQTLWISALALLLAGALGLVLALLRLSPSWSGRAVAGGIVEVVRTTPLIVQISMFYFVLAPIFGIDRFWTGVLSLALFESVFIAEIFRAGIVAVPLSQWEAGTSLGLSRAHIYRYIALPQAVRIMAPPLTGAAISLIKDSSIVSVIALFELTTAGRDAISLTYMSFEIWLTVAAIYLALTFTLSVVARQFERRLNLAL